MTFWQSKTVNKFNIGAFLLFEIYINKKVSTKGASKMNQTKCNLVTYIYLITSRQQLTFIFIFKKLRVRIVNKISSFPPCINNER